MVFKYQKLEPLFWTRFSSKQIGLKRHQSFKAKLENLNKIFQHQTYQWNQVMPFSEFIFYTLIKSERILEFSMKLSSLFIRYFLRLSYFVLSLREKNRRSLKFWNIIKVMRHFYQFWSSILKVNVRIWQLWRKAFPTLSTSWNHCF